MLSRESDIASNAIELLLRSYFDDQTAEVRATLLHDITFAPATRFNADSRNLRTRRPYVSPDRLPSSARRDPFEVDPDVVDRGNRAHASTLDALAKFLRDRGLEPLRPDPGDPTFDLAWNCDGVLFVAEVKSITSANEEKQLRLGLGQVLRYRQALETTEKMEVVPVLVPETKPSDLAWLQLSDSLGVALAWPGGFELLTDAR